MSNPIDGSERLPHDAVSLKFDDSADITFSTNDAPAWLMLMGYLYIGDCHILALILAWQYFVAASASLKSTSTTCRLTLTGS